MSKTNFYNRITFPFRRSKNELKDLINWEQRGFAAPSPNFVKHQVLLRNGIPNGIWIETGTYKGDTSALLARYYNKVYTIEPATQLFEDAKKRFKDIPNVTVINGLSELVFPTLLPTIQGDVNFWLDGHYSTGITYQGPKDCPLIEELNAIERALPLYSRVAILVDDVRYCVNPAAHQFSGYPPLSTLVDWANRNQLLWHIEHDTMVIKTPSLYKSTDV